MSQRHVGRGRQVRRDRAQREKGRENGSGRDGSVDSTRSSSILRNEGRTDVGKGRKHNKLDEAVNRTRDKGSYESSGKAPATDSRVKSDGGRRLEKGPRNALVQNRDSGKGTVVH